MSTTRVKSAARSTLTRLPKMAAVGVLLLVVTTGCTPDAGTDSGAPSSGTSPSATSSTGATPTPTSTASATPTATPTPSPSLVAIPTDCRALVSPEVLSYFGSTPLNDPLTGVVTGAQPDGGVICLWREPQADTTYLITTISRENRGPALELLNGLAATQGFTCFSPDGGTRCEKTWQNANYPVTDGRTLFWRDDILIDTSYSNMAPPGYTSSIVAALWG